MKSQSKLGWTYPADAEIFNRVKALGNRGRQVTEFYHTDRLLKVDSLQVPDTGNSAKPKPRRHSELVARDLGTYSRKVEKIWSILDYGDPEIHAAVDSGRLSIQAAYEQCLVIRDRLIQVAETATPEPGNLGQTLLALLKTTIPQKTWRRTWHEDDFELFALLVKFLHQNHCICDAELELLERAIGTEKQPP